MQSRRAIDEAKKGSAEVVILAIVETKAITATRSPS